MKNKSWFFFLLLTCSCYRVPNKVEPELSYHLEESYLDKLPSAFPPLSNADEKEEWGREYKIGLFFAKELDFYRALTAFKRSLILLPEKEIKRKTELQYDILLCYYLARRYEDVAATFINSNLPNVDKSFPLFHDLLVILYESYKELHETEKVERIQELLEQSFPETYDKLQLTASLYQADVPELKKKGPHALSPVINYYEAERKSVSKAQMLNAVLPGAGYFYVGQKKSALTALLINSLFIAASYEFFHHGYVAAGIITAGFEAGWYFGGIYGAGEEARYYNERLYEKEVSHAMEQEKLFPFFMLQHSF